ncbi:hypothetical protein GIB67_000279 [Kingdonia uniflora]|uniref:Pentatricopeptide repeat-containing protein n=1 Tax=Kingdonia uniflora TaxID=39325 RepID=A0A7J7LC31_9MAGN|nr:hypothetical protein GIB67_000279 [Kingdonia uniflora]
MIRCTPHYEGIRVFADGIARGDLLFDKLSYVYVLGACARARASLTTALWEGKQIHTRVVKSGFLLDVMVQTTLVHFYANNNELGAGRKVFDEMTQRTSASWNAMISGYCNLHEKMVTNDAQESLNLFCEMLVKSGEEKPNGRTMVCVLSACSRLGELALGSCVHGYIQKVISEPDDDVFIGTGLIDMYSKCGSLYNALSVFDRMKAKNVFTWTAMVAGLALHGRGKEALTILCSMESTNVKPNAITFTNLLFACCHAGLVEEGIHLFDIMISQFDIAPNVKHYGCLVDLLGRAGQLVEAYEFIIGMECEGDAILWRSLLGSCKIHGDAVMGEKVGNILLELQRDEGSIKLASSCQDFIALSNVYASAERWEDVVAMREMMEDKRLQTNPGRSSVHS